MNGITDECDPSCCRWCRYKLECCICYSPECKYAKKKYGLTERECSILNEFCTCDGTSKHVARKLKISVKTIEIMIAAIKKKMKVNSRIQAILNWDRAIQEFKHMDNIKPIHPHDIFEMHDGEWYYRVDLGDRIPEDATLWPHNSPHWHLLVKGEAHGTRQKAA